MIKRIRPVPSAPVHSVDGLNLEDGLEVELTSEDLAWPIEGALLPQLVTTGHDIEHASMLSTKMA